jgi:hypothetical protein
MTGGGLRRNGGPYGAEGAYYTTGTLSGITGPGKRTVRSLALRRLGPDEDLSVLRTFDDLKTLELERVTNLDLRPLEGLGLEQLSVTESSGLDLAPLACLPRLDSLVLGNLADLTVPRLALASSLRLLVVINDDPKLTGAPVRRIVEAIDWSRIADLRTLSLRVGGLYEMPPISIDLGFLRHLPRLEHLDMYQGLRHSGASPSPIEPPFEGLSRKLNFVRIDSDEPAATRTALCAYLASDPDDPESGIVVSERLDSEPPSEEWAITGPVDGVWTAYGSLHRAELGTAEDTEYEACERAQKLLHKTDAGLSRRLDFDPESAGTGIMASSPEDLERALLLLDLRR